MCYREFEEFLIWHWIEIKSELDDKTNNVEEAAVLDEMSTFKMIWSSHVAQYLGPSSMVGREGHQYHMEKFHYVKSTLANEHNYPVVPLHSVVFVPISVHFKLF